MLVLPGPAVVVIPAGLAILATEFPWARRLLRQVRDGVARGTSLFKRRPSPPDPPAQRHGTPNTPRAPGD
jgi:putative transmembrane protein PGPGW